MSQFSLFRQRRFAPFFWTQALSAFNDNAFRNALLMLVAFQLGLDNHAVSLYSNLAPALFILPFCLFSATAGQLAEKYEKSRIIRYVQCFEIVVMVVAAVGFITCDVPLLLLMLFMMGVHSTLFGPIKYAILPQALKPSELIGGNGLVEMSTQLAILVGMIAGNELMRIAGVGPWLSAAATVAVAVAGYLASRAIPPARAIVPDLRLNLNPFVQTARVIGMTWRHRSVWIAVLGISWFWFFGTVLMAQLPVYTRQILGGDGSVYTLVLTLFSVGSGIGALLCERLSAYRTEIGLAPLGMLGMTVSGVDLYLARHGLSRVHGLDWLEVLHGSGSVRLVLDLTLTGLFSSLYVVPLFAFMQIRAPREEISRLVAGNNIMNSVLIVLAAGFGLGLGALGLNTAEIFLCAALLNVPVAVCLFGMLPEFITHFIVWVLVHGRCQVRTNGLQYLPDEGPAILVCHRLDAMQAMVLMARLHRPVRMVMDERYMTSPLLRFILRTEKTIPLHTGQPGPVSPGQITAAVSAALAAGEVVCLPVSGAAAMARPDFKKILAQHPVALIPIALRVVPGRLGKHHAAFRSGCLRGILRMRARLCVDVPVPARDADAATLEARVWELCAQMR